MSESPSEGRRAADSSARRRLAISLVLATIGKRPDEFARFLASLSAQTCGSFELVVVDQSDALEVIGQIESSGLSQAVTHLRKPPGLSAARNAGWRVASGDLVAFPDDDCWYHPELLENVVSVLSRHRDWAGVCGVTRDRDGALSLARFDSGEGFVNLRNVWRQGVEPAMFFRTDLLHTVGGFHEGLGVGASTPFQAGEGTELLIRAVRAGRRVRFMPQLHVGHEQATVDASPGARSRARGYGRGIGRVLRISSLPTDVTVAMIVRPLVGAGVAAVRGQWPLARFRWSAFRGRLEGLLTRAPT